MIIVRLCGGLGNQMFQYAAGLALARQQGTELRFDLAWFDRVQLHQGLELHRVFGLPLPQPSRKEMNAVLGWAARPLARRALSRSVCRWMRPSTWVSEPYFHYWSAFETIGPDAYLDGYWQSWHYFAGVEPLVRECFRFAQPLDECNTKLVQKMSACNSVSVHVRRGDFARDPAIQRVHGVDLSGYYRAAVGQIQKYISSPHFFIFSDEPEWATKHLSLRAPFTIVAHNRGKDSYRDMQLMASCRHHIIANSTFSWWGAWLNPSPKKIVIAPREWFRVADCDTKDLYCPGWIVL